MKTPEFSPEFLKDQQSDYVQKRLRRAFDPLRKERDLLDEYRESLVFSSGRVPYYKGLMESSQSSADWYEREIVELEAEIKEKEEKG